MANPMKVWHLCPTFDISPPPDGPLVLGSIVANRQRLWAPINRLSKPQIPSYLAVKTSEQSQTKHTVSKAKDAKFGLFANIAQIMGIGASANVNRNDISKVEYAFEKEITLRFEPDAAFIGSSTDNEKVKEYRKINGDRGPVYMVTGLKYVKGATMTTSVGQKRGVAFDIKADATATGVPLRAGAEANRSTHADEIHSSGDSSPFVFCVHLKKIWWDRRGRMHDDDEHKGAWMSAEGANPADLELKANDDTAKEFNDSAVATMEQENNEEWDLVYSFDNEQ